MGLATVYDAIIAVIYDEDTLEGAYFGDQLAFSAYPVACVGVPGLLGEVMPVIAQHSVRNETYTAEIIIYVKFADTAANALSIITLTEAMRDALRADMKPPNQPLSGECYTGELGDSKFVYGEKEGGVRLRISVTKVEYTKRIVV